MSKTFSVGMLAQLRSRRSRLTTCILLTRRDGNQYGFTMHDRPLTINGLIYEPTASFNASDIASNFNMDLDNFSLEALIDSRTLTEDDLRAGKWDYATHRIFQVCWEDLTIGDKKDRTGHLGQVTVGRATFLAELLGLMEAYTISIGEITSPGCRANLGDQRCKVDLIGGSPSLTVTGTVTNDFGDFFTFDDNSRTEVTTYFTEGVVTFTSGLLNGLSYEIKSYELVVSAGGLFITKLPMAYSCAGATYSVHAGCDKSLDTCRDRFSNVANFRGEPWLRGPDAMIQVGRSG